MPRNSLQLKTLFALVYLLICSTKSNITNFKSLKWVWMHKHRWHYLRKTQPN